jgi:glucokinase
MALVSASADQDALYACVDLGSSKVVLALAHARGWLIRLQEATVKSGAEDAVPQQILRMLHQACAEAGVDIARLKKIGVASCGPFVRRQGLIALAAPNLCGALAQDARGLNNTWSAIPLEHVLRTQSIDVQIENDCVASLIAERRWGALQHAAHCAYVTWSTGIGVGLCVDDVILRGKNGNAGHAGHMLVAAQQEWAKCGCGNVGDVEGSSGGYSLSAASGLSTEQLIEHASRGVEPARAMWQHAAQCFTRMLYNLIVTLDLQAIALGGSVFQHNQRLIFAAIEREFPAGLKSLSAQCQIIPAGLGQRVGDYAALALVAPAAWSVEQFVS